MIRKHVVSAVARRNFRSYFSGVLGYLFILVFCVAAAAMTFSTAFFAANQANLDQLTQAFPWLLLFVIPAITMTAWADERKLGTDELLFTLPATEAEVLAGKYLAVVGVYGVALVFSLANVIVLFLLGSPDIGAVIASYVGYFFAGSALLSAGMLASALTSSATVGFVLGVVLCCIPVMLYYATDLVEWLLGLFGAASELYELRNALSALSLQQQLLDFSVGILPLNGVIWFLSFSAVMLYLNLVVISRRRWSEGREKAMGMQFGIRAASVAVTCGSLLYILSFVPTRADLSAENLYTLSDATIETLDLIRSGESITVQAFISPEVPADYVETRRQLVGLLREFGRSSGGTVIVREVAVEPFSEEAEEARALGIEPVRLQYDRDGKREEAEVFLGAFLQSPSDELVIPFFGKGLPIEYELTRSLRTVSSAGRLKVGVLQTDAQVMSEGAGGGRWEIIRELEKQYQVVSVNPSQPILMPAMADAGETDTAADAEVNFDVLLAIMPSSLTEPQMANFLAYVGSGRPALIFDDPCPFVFQTQAGLSMAPRMPKPGGGGGMFGGGGQQPEPKADNGQLTGLMTALNVRWDNGEIAYDRSNPHSQFATLPPEYVFISRSGGEESPFGGESAVSEMLQDMVMLYPGTIVDRAGRSEQKFVPLLQTSAESGLLGWDDYTTASFSPFSMSPSRQIIPNPRRADDRDRHVVAAQITNDSEETPLNVIFCADIDLITDWFFMERNRGMLDVQFDNVTFVLNAVDKLAGDETFIPLRSRRETLRTLKFVESRTSSLRQNLNREEQDAQTAMDKELEEAEEKLRTEMTAIEGDQSLDSRSRDVQLAQLEEKLNRQLEVRREQLERDVNGRIRRAALEMKREVRRVENTVRIVACVAPAILPICFGMLFLGMRNRAESQSITPGRRKS
jgi:ABC-2 type transport system permease protein